MTDDTRLPEISDAARGVLDVLNPTLVEQLAADLGDFAPGLAELIIDTAYGGLYSRPGVDLKTRQLATVAALTVMGGHNRPQLQANIGHALAAGATEEEIVEIIMQMLIYAGAPAVINAIWAAREVLRP